jgi:hypothetical protein
MELVMESEINRVVERLFPKNLIEFDYRTAVAPDNRNRNILYLFVNLFIQRAFFRIILFMLKLLDMTTAVDIEYLPCCKFVLY